jgi:tRNA U34 2-thiouridine synthase MnmA/TrmU
VYPAETFFSGVVALIIGTLGITLQALFPLANLQKSTDVRVLAKAFDLPTAEREESMGVCFIGERRGTFGSFVCKCPVSRLSIIRRSLFVAEYR